MSGLEKVLEEIIEQLKAEGCIIDNAAGNRAEEIIRKHMNDLNDDWVPVDERLPEEPKENPVFDDKPLELYLVDIGGSYPLRAFWNGKQFTDGWSVLNVIAWRPLPEPYCPDRSDNHDGE